MTLRIPSSYRYGVLMILSAALVISTQDVTIKLFSADMTLWQIFAMRGVMVMLALISFAIWRGAPARTFGQALGLWPMLRALFITTTFLAYYAALPFISLSTAGAANYSAPIFITLMSAFVLHQAVSAMGWLAVLTGFIGVFLLLRPGSDAFSGWTVLPVMGACFYAMTHIITRTKCRDTPLLALALSQSLVMMLAGFMVSTALALIQPEEMARVTPYIFGPWADMTPSLWLVLLALAVLAIGAAVLLTGAYQAAPPVIIGTLEYSYLIFVILWDVTLFGLVPNGVSLIGMALIVCAGLMVIRAPSPQP